MRPVLLWVWAVSFAALAKDKALLTFQPADDDPADRPLARQIDVAPQGSDYALRVQFDKLPWGGQCGNRCANATIFLDTDNSKSTGLQLSDKAAAENGADLAVTLQGVRELFSGASGSLLRVRVRQLGDDVTRVDDGQTMAELDHRHDPERVYMEGTTVFVRVDATSGVLPTGKKMRVIYHPPATQAVTATTHGFLAGGRGKVEIFRGGKRVTGAKP
ncbi:MAG: hypothetical protein ACOZIN_16750 [Myxococcota bacterium]